MDTETPLSYGVFEGYELVRWERSLMAKTLIHPKQLRKTLRELVGLVEDAALDAGNFSRISAGFELEGFAAFEEDDVAALALKLRGDVPASFPVNTDAGVSRQSDDEMESHATFKLWFRVDA